MWLEKDVGHMVLPKCIKKTTQLWRRKAETWHSRAPGCLGALDVSGRLCAVNVQTLEVGSRAEVSAEV